MLRRVAFVRTDVSEELSASFIRVTRIGELGTALAVTSNRRTLRRNTECHRRETLKSYMVLKLWAKAKDVRLILHGLFRNGQQDLIGTVADKMKWF
jgi:hypothetical protein